MKYLLEADLSVIHTEKDIQNSHYSMVYSLEPLREVGKDAAVYMKDLDMWFEDPSALATVFEIELTDVHMKLNKEVSKSTDFFRRTLYRYDWLQPKISKSGRLIFIENLDELRKQWKGIRAKINEVYKGDVVDDYIASVDDAMTNQDFRLTPMSQYFYFGLMIPCIPPTHKLDWQKDRLVTMFDFDGVQFMEHIAFERIDGQNRRFSITGSETPESGCTLNKFSGYMLMPPEDIHPAKAQVEVNYTKEDITANWNFELTKQ